MPHTVRMIATDLDGTLLGPDGQVSPRNRMALQLAAQAGVEVVVATGRRHCYAMKVLRELDLHDESILVSSNGAVVRTVASNGATRLLERRHLDSVASTWLLSTLGELRNALVITFDRVDESGMDQRGALVVEDLADLHRSIDRWMIANEPYIERIVPIEDALTGEAPIQMMLCGTVDRMRRAEALLLENPAVSSVSEQKAGGFLQLNRTEYPERDLSIVDILPAGCSKGNALLRLCAERSIPASELMVLGDNWNDLSMLEVAGHPILMANAPADLKAYAVSRGWRLTTSNAEDGVAEAVEQALSVARQWSTTHPGQTRNSGPPLTQN